MKPKIYSLRDTVKGIQSFGLFIALIFCPFNIHIIAILGMFIFAFADKMAEFLIEKAEETDMRKIQTVDEHLRQRK